MRLLVTLLFLVPLCAQPPQEGGRKGGPPPTPKNLKILKVPPTDLIQTMRSFNAGLGVRCDFCHVQGDFASDEKHNKEIARMMIALAQEANAKFPDGKVHVTCYTCHRGETEPKMAPPPAAPPGQ